MTLRLKLILWFLLPVSAFATEPKSIHVVVALCDNESQGIMPVNARIGDGDQPSTNLYWGCSDGMREWFKKSPHWETLKIEPAKRDDKKILETASFKHRKTGAILVAEAWRGSEIEAATNRYLELLSSELENRPDFVAYIGHNGLMDFEKPDISLIRKSASPPDTSILCCISRATFTPILKVIGARPILMTEQFMYPGSFLLDAALEGWLQEEPPEQIRKRAIVAYSKNQKINISAAQGIFTKLE